MLALVLGALLFGNGYALQKYYEGCKVEGFKGESCKLAKKMNAQKPKFIKKY